MKFDKLPETISAKLQMTPEVFDSLPEEVQRQLVESIKKISDVEEEKEGYKKVIENSEKAIETLKSYIRMEPAIEVNLESLGLTESEAMIKSTKEYGAYKRKLLQQIENNELTLEEGNKLLDEFVSSVIRENRKIRSKQYKERLKESTIRKDKKEYSRYVEISKMFREVRYEDYPIEEYQVLGTEDWTIAVPTKTLILDIIDQMKTEMMEKNGIRKNPSFIPQVTTRFSWNKRNVSNTKLIVASGLTWYERFIDSIVDKCNVLTNKNLYEETCDPENPVLKITLIYRELRTVKDWFDEEISNTIKYGDFELFTANRKDKPCLEQCLEYFGLKYNNEYGNNLSMQFAPMRTIIYSPLVELNVIKSFSDLMVVEDSSPDDLDLTNDCTNIVRLLEYKNHVGVIINIQIQSKPWELKRTRIRSKSEPDYEEVSADIETFVDMNTKLIKPYLISWAKFNDKTIKHHSGIYCIKEFCKTIIESFDKVIIYFWNGAAFDFQLVIGTFKQMSLDEKIFIRNGKIIFASLKFENCSVILKDPCLFIPSSLSDAAKSFEVINKGDFPHEIVKDFQSLEEVIKDWYILRKDVVFEDDTENPKIKLVKTHSYKEYMESDNGKTILEKAKEYCSIDVLCCMNIWIKFRQIIKNLFKINIGLNTFTCPQLAFQIMKSMIPEHITMKVPSRNEYEFIRESIYGGRVVAKNGIYHSKKGFALLDVVSLYPTAMYYFDHPYGKPYLVKTINWDKLGIYEVELDGTKMTEKQIKNYPEIVPFRIGTKLEYAFRKKWKGMYNTYDLMNAKKAGYNIQVYTGIEYPYKGKIFKDFVEILFDMKKNNKGAKRKVAKIGLNGAGYGKFVQKHIDEEVIIVSNGTIQTYIEQNFSNGNGTINIGEEIMQKPEFYELDENWDKMVIKVKGEVMYPTQNGSFILSAARNYMYQKINEVGCKIYYSDTDSLLINTDKIDSDPIEKLIGENLGQMTDEIDGHTGARAHEVIIAGPKMYSLKYMKDGKEREYVRAKGVPKIYRTHSLLKHLGKDAENMVITECNFIKRNLVNLKSIDISKEIKQIFKDHK
jgi:hypothetical protein